jgi:single-strand DNA-binding protein
MDMSNNTIVIIGRLGQDPEPKGSGVKLSVAVDRPGKDRDGNKQTDWFTCWVHDKQAEIAQQYLTKGSLISVAGRMSCNKTPEGQHFWSINAQSFQMLGSNNQQAPAVTPEPEPVKAKPRPKKAEMETDDDELPPF